jgi:pSer/pThr/pTyr-binding forkhead associated (FHA) protein
LKKLEDGGCCREVAIEELPLVIGRSCDALICLDDRWVSRRHCEIDQVDGTLVVRDLGSKHGTYVNDQRINQAVLRPGDRLNVGLSVFVASFEAEPQI